MPNSSSCRVNGIFRSADDEYLKICVVSIPEKGKANKELLSFLSKILGVAKSQCEIVSGELDRYKKIKITGDLEILKKAMYKLEIEANYDGKNN